MQTVVTLRAESPHSFQVARGLLLTKRLSLHESSWLRAVIEAPKRILATAQGHSQGRLAAVVALCSLIATAAELSYCS